MNVPVGIFSKKHNTIGAAVKDGHRSTLYNRYNCLIIFHAYYLAKCLDAQLFNILSLCVCMYIQLFCNISGKVTKLVTLKYKVFLKNKNKKDYVYYKNRLINLTKFLRKRKLSLYR